MRISENSFSWDIVRNPLPRATVADMDLSPLVTIQYLKSSCLFVDFKKFLPIFRQQYLNFETSQVSVVLALNPFVDFMNL